MPSLLLKSLYPGSENKFCWKERGSELPAAERVRSVARKVQPERTCCVGHPVGVGPGVMLRGPRVRKRTVLGSS